MTPSQLRKLFIDFFINPPRNHKQIPPSSLIPKDDPTTLFTGSGMQQLVPYLKGSVHPMGNRLVDCQPCFRAEDVNEVGDDRHTTFFEMLGNWSLGDYFKKQQLNWFFDFLTQKVGLNPNNLFVTVFAGNDQVVADKESIEIWQKIFNTKNPAVPGENGFNQAHKIYTYDATKNWWSRSGTPDKMPAGEIGGPDSEVFYDFGEKLRLHENSKFKNQPCHVNCDCGRFLEIGNSVFMEYVKQTDGSFKPLPAKNVDFGGGLERIAAAQKNDPDIFTTQLFRPIIQEIEKLTGKKYEGNSKKSFQVIADHLKAAMFMIADGLQPGNKKQGYILRRLFRRSAVKMHELNDRLKVADSFNRICAKIVDIYDHCQFRPYEELIFAEINKFELTLSKGLNIFEKTASDKLTTLFAFDLFQTYGFPYDVTEELFKKRGIKLNKQEFENVFDKHKQLSRSTSKDMFKGGLADHSDKTTRLHTATHLLHAALRKVLGSHVAQVGSNITSERLRFDFTHPAKLTDIEISAVEKMVNEQIKNNLKISFENMPLSEAQGKGALAFFGQRYPEIVKVYTIEGENGIFSMEVCGGPHADFTGDLGIFRIIKQEASGAGKRRIYAVLD